MRALILAAGHGKRLRPLTNSIPKPLIEVGGRLLIDRHLEALTEAGITDVVVNTAHLGRLIHDHLGDGRRWGLRIRFSHEGDQPLETGGGMLRALGLLGPEPFLAVNADIITDFDFRQLPENPAGLAHLVLVENPEFNRDGDFVLDSSGQVPGRGPGSLTFAGIGVYRPQLLVDQVEGTFSVVPLLEEAMEQGKVSGERHDGLWQDIGTPDRLATARQLFS